jgi:hypothetical protein
LINIAIDNLYSVYSGGEDDSMERLINFTIDNHYSALLWGDRDSIERLINIAIDNLYSAVLGGIGCFDRDVSIEIDQYRNRQSLLGITLGGIVIR